MKSGQKHRWSEPVRFERKSERTCLNGCGIVKVTRHEGDLHWAEFWRGLDKIDDVRTPPCTGSPDQQALTFSPKRNVITNGDSHEADH